MTKCVIHKLTKSVVTMTLATVGIHAMAQTPDACTDKLDRYLATLEKNVASEHISPRQKEASQKLIDKAKRLRADEEFVYTDCAVFDKLLF